jgi:hypothetical protein
LGVALAVGLLGYREYIAPARFAVSQMEIQLAKNPPVAGSVDQTLQALQRQTAAARQERDELRTRLESLQASESFTNRDQTIRVVSAVEDILYRQGLRLEARERLTSPRGPLVEGPAELRSDEYRYRVRGGFYAIQEALEALGELPFRCLVDGIVVRAGASRRERNGAGLEFEFSLTIFSLPGETP